MTKRLSKAVKSANKAARAAKTNGKKTGPTKFKTLDQLEKKYNIKPQGITITAHKGEAIPSFITTAVREANEFQQSINHRIAQTDILLMEKGKEYVKGVIHNRYHNFDRVAEMNRINATRALHGMLSKHIVSYLDMLDEIDNGIKIPVARVEEKFGDMVCYLHLQEALIKSRHSIK